MKGQTAMEYPFKIMIYIVVFMVIVGIVVNFRKQIASILHLCDLLPGSCEEQGCSTIERSEAKIDAAVLKNYCNLCWEKTGKKNYNGECWCYIVKGSFSPVQFQDENCNLECEKDASSVYFVYEDIFKLVHIKC